jgi:ubiquinone/menaquinone biosynthesis C-methylase UbiE
MLPRKLETEVMDSAAEAADYDSMDHSEVNRIFADDFVRALGAGETLSPTIAVLDVGTGTALIPIEIARRQSGIRITAVDLAAPMLQLAQKNVIREGLGERIKLDHVDAKQLPYSAAEFDAVISNSIIHHIPEPRNVFREMVRVVRPDGWLFIRDLLRPADLETHAQLVATYAGDANPHQRQMFSDSLHAALTLVEVQALLFDSGLPLEWAQQTSDRHWTISGRPPGQV